VLAERGRHTQQHRVGLRELARIRGGAELLRVGELAGEAVAEVAQIVLAALEPLHLAVVHVEAEHREAGIVEGPGERQPDVAEPHDADAGGARGDLLLEVRRRRGQASCRCVHCCSWGCLRRG